MANGKTVYDHIGQNNLKTFLLILAFPATLAAVLYGVLYLLFLKDPDGVNIANNFFLHLALPVVGIAFLWTAISYWFGDKMMLGFAGAKLAPDDKEHTQIYRAVENVAIAAGLPTPKIYLIDDESLNAFATGHSPQTASIALTTGIVKKLKPLELQAVIAHEMGHVGNRDIRLNMIIITGLGVSALLADILFRFAAASGRDSNKEAGQAKAAIMLIGIALMIFTFIIAPIIRLALSRTREYAADATAAYITRNPMALASALQKISEDARVEALDKSPSMATACIYDPTDPNQVSFLGLGNTHPSVADRIKRLQEMNGQFQSGQT